MLLSTVRNGITKATRRVAHKQNVAAVRAFSDAMDQRKKASMDQYFRAEDEKLMEELVAKMESHQKEMQTLCSKDADAHEALRRKEFAELESLLAPYSLPKDQLYSIMKWKHGGKFVNEDWSF